jgi:hypothetical protein
MNYSSQGASKSIVSLVFLFSFLLSLSSCSTKYVFATSSSVPAAQGWVKVKSDNNKNYSINLQVKMLAEPGKLTPPKAQYIVWIGTDNENSVNIGRLNSHDTFFSSMLEGSLKTTTPIKPKGFFITAENESSSVYSGGMVVLTTK